MREWKLAETRYGVVRDRRYEVAVLPIGSTEPHGLHLPYCTDAYEVESLADLACQRAHAMGAKVLLLPTIPYGVNTNHLAIPVAISLNPSTLDAVIVDVMDSLEHHGIPKLVLLNGHGGNQFNNLLREMHGRTSLFVTWVDAWKIAAEERAALFAAPGEHADEMETSWMLHVRPDLVALSEADDGAVNQPRIRALREGWAWYVRPWEKLTRNTGYGDPRGATAEKGAQFLQASADKLAAFLKELSDAQLDDKFPY
jgi:creatinine amidohydrolase